MINFLNIFSDKNYLFLKISNLSTCKKFITVFFILFFIWAASWTSITVTKMRWDGIDLSSFFPHFLKCFLSFMSKSVLVYFFSKVLKGKGSFSNTILGLGVAKFPILLFWIPIAVYFVVMLSPVLSFKGIEIIMLYSTLIFSIFLHLLALDYSISIIKTVHSFSRWKAFGVIIISTIIVGYIKTKLF